MTPRSGPAGALRRGVPSILLLLLGCASNVTRDGTVPAREVASGIRAELLAMAARDQEVREVDLGSIEESERRAEFERRRAVDRENTARLAAIVDAHGWPAATWAGEDGAHAAWLLVQHADQDPAFQRRCLPLLEEAARRGEGELADVAYLTDRVLTAGGRPQLYGTQYESARDAEGRTLLDAEGNFVYEPPLVVDAEHLDERRAAMGLGPWREYEAAVAEVQRREPFDAPRDAGTDADRTGP
ncbi:MAG: DUF6624 domain-containing protein [Planctomycetota bacterium]